MLIFFIIFLIILFYVILIIRYYFGWKNTDDISVKSFSPRVSIIIAMRNEENQIVRIIRNLKLLIYPQDKIEFILINDHSNDDTLKLLQSSKLDNLNILDMPKNKFGKKNAISLAVDIAKGEIILTTDADCSFDSNWVQSMASCFIDNNVKLVSGPVCFNKKKSIFHYFQSLDFASLVGSGAASIGAKDPIFCNGANMAFRKEVFLELNAFRNDHLVSGDDVFLLHSIKARYLNSIAFLKAKSAIVFTDSMDNFKELINQRKRWAAKASAYTDITSIYTAYLILFINLSFLFLFFSSFFSIKFFQFFMFFYCTKFIVDFFFLYPVLKFFDRKDLLKWVFIFEFFYSFYIILIVILSLIKKFEWKGRMHKR